MEDGTNDPKASVIRNDGINGVTYRLVGGTLAEGWKARECHEAWCEIRVYEKENGILWIGVYGGEVWPGAWPALFNRVDAGTHGSWFEVTEKGRALLALAK